MLEIPNGCCEYVFQNGQPKNNCFRVLRTLLNKEPQKKQTN